jgi:hypothetical protein
LSGGSADTNSDRVMFCFADGAVHPLRTSTPLTILRALATRAGAEVVDGSEF